MESILHSSDLSALEILQIPQWTGHEWLAHGFSTRKGGVSQVPNAPQSAEESRPSQLNLGFTVDNPVDAVAENRRRFLDAVEEAGRPWQPARRRRFGLVTLKQMHSSLARRVGSADASERPTLWGDALLTDEPGVMLGIQTADCLPILIADRRRRAVAAVHAGWRGTLKGVVQSAVEAMRREFASRLEDLSAAIGPGIGSCCFQIGPEVRDLFAARFSYAADLFTPGDTLRLDLVEANRRQLVCAGVPQEAIRPLGECTSCHLERFFSYRAERGHTGRMMAVIGIR